MEAQRPIGFGTRVLVSAGVSQGDASLPADRQVTAEPWGHPCQGTRRLPWDVLRQRSGAMMPVTRLDPVVDSGAFAMREAYGGIGQVLASEATRLGLDRARAQGVNVVAVRNSNDCSAAG
jgi:LDH2 family malate/lactate/ureidoglycolate dehydrogenase